MSRESYDLETIVDNSLLTNTHQVFIIATAQRCESSNSSNTIQFSGSLNPIFTTQQASIGNKKVINAQLNDKIILSAYYNNSTILERR